MRNIFAVAASWLLLTGQFAWSMTPEQLVQIQQIALAKLSPDGKSIAYLKSIPRDPDKHPAGNSWQELMLVNKKGLIRPLISGKNEIKRIQWNSKSDQIWLLMRRAHDKFYGIYMIRSDGGEALKVIGRDTNIHGFSLGNSNATLIYWMPKIRAKNAPENINNRMAPITFEEEYGLNNQLYSLSLVETDASEKLLPISGHILNAKLARDEDTVLIKWAPSYLIDDEIMKPEFIVADISGKVKSRFSGFGKLHKAIFSPDATRIAFIGALTPSSPDHGQLYLGDINTGNVQLLLEDFKGMVTDIAWPVNRHIQFTADIGTESILGQKRTGSPSSNYKTLIADSGVFTSIHSVNNSALIIANSAKHPNELFWYRDNKMLRVTKSNPQHEATINTTQKNYTFKGQDDLAMEGILVSPKSSSKATPLPTVIFVHGGPEAHVSNGWVSRYSQPASVLATHGVRSFFPNYRGSSGRGDAFLKLGQEDYAGAEFEDILAAKKWLVKQGFSVPDQIAIIGASYGGYAAAWGATRFSEHFRAAVMIAGISHQVSKFGTTDISTEMLQTHALSMPWENWETWLKASPIYYSHQHKTPLLMIHGINDTRVHYSQSMEMYRHLKLRDQAPVRLLLYPEQGHTVTHSYSQLDITRQIVTWIKHFVLDEKTELPTQLTTAQTAP